MNHVSTRYRLVSQGIRGGRFYCVDKTTGKRTGLQITNKHEAQQIVEAKNQAERQPVINLHIAKAYLAGTDNGMAARTWQDALQDLSRTTLGSNQQRWQRAAKEKALTPLLSRVPCRLAPCYP